MTQGVLKTHGICLMMYFKNNWNAGPFFFTLTGHGMFIYFLQEESEDTKGAKLQILLNKMDVYFLLVSDYMSINAKFPVMFIG
jgi:hypothetical protein